MQIRKLKMEDSLALSLLLNACFDTPFIMSGIGQTGIEYWGAFDGTRLVATVGLQTEDGDMLPDGCVPGEAILFNVATEVGYRKQGLAKKLIGRAVAYSRLQRHEKVRLQVRANNAEAIGLYERLGFYVERSQMLHTTKGLEKIMDMARDLNSIAKRFQ